ncbi:hypothetical protein O181_076987 [Austropuccinia psidii MF-1]|uniref:Uncharacterized protein n=1 Tax=Austropuccinia psidii MF-1 TaxID=1389203 RepID=A0A9Q3FHW7_9BASI|nr:hypothetical protein [Austropuccinia psidii MF-1]
MLEIYGMGDCQAVSTPFLPNNHLSVANKEDLSAFSALKLGYRSAIGSLNYLSTATRPDLSYTDLDLVYHKGNTSGGIAAYCDADWCNSPNTRRLMMIFLATFDGCLVIWKTRKQPTVSLSTLEAEYTSLCDVTSELLWLKQWCMEANLVNGDSTIPVHEDNQGCISTANGDTSIN